MTDLRPLEAAVLPEGVRARFVDGVNGLRMHLLEAGFETPGRPLLLLLHGFPELAYSWRKIIGLVLHPSLHDFSRKKLDCADFFARKAEWPIMFSAINHNEFLTGFFRRRQLSDAIQSCAHSKFFHKFAHGGLVIVFVSFHVTRCARIPEQGMPVFPRGTLLQQDLPGMIENEDMNGTMTKVILMDFQATGGANWPIVFIHYRKSLS